jgi:hypothetical protein
VIPPSPSVASAQTAAEAVELSYINSNSNNEYPAPVTTQNLFRGQVYPGDGNVAGPYLSQFMVQPTALGVQPISQLLQSFFP